MLTTVRRDILDHSISGNKIFGGSINWIDGLYTDYIEIPHSSAHPEDGGGLVDGNGVLIGSRVPVGILESLSVKARTEFGLRDEAFTGYSIYAARVIGGAYLRVRNSAGSTKVYLGTGTAQKSYFLDKLIIGKTTNNNPASALEVTTGFIDTLVFGSLVGPVGTINLLFTKDPLDATVSLTSIIGLVYDLNSFVLEEPFITLSNMTAAQAGQLLKITELPEITSNSWGHLSSLDQDIGIGDEVSFKSVSIGTLNTGETSNTLENYKEWMGVDVNMTYGNAPMPPITLAIKANIIKNGKIVSIMFYNPGNDFMTLVNSSGSPLSGLPIVISFSDSKYNPMLKLSSPLIVGGIVYFDYLNGSDMLIGRNYMRIIAPNINNKEVYIQSLNPPDNFGVTIANGFKIKITNFTITYCIDR